MCPHCHRDAPIVMEGMRSYCTACGKPRAAFSGKVVNLVGQPSRVGGSLARLVGFATIGVGVLAGLLLGTLLQAIFPAALIGWVFGAVLAIVAVVVGVVMIRGGSSLRAYGTSRADTARAQAVRHFARAHGGRITVEEAARTLNLTAEEADAALMTMLKRDEATIEVDETTGAIAYRLGGGERVKPDPRVRVSDRPLADDEADLEDDAEQHVRKPLRFSRP